MLSDMFTLCCTGLISWLKSNSQSSTLLEQSKMQVGAANFINIYFSPFILFRSTLLYIDGSFEVIVYITNNIGFFFAYTYY